MTTLPRLKYYVLYCRRTKFPPYPTSTFQKNYYRKVLDEDEFRVDIKVSKRVYMDSVTSVKLKEYKKVSNVIKYLVRYIREDF